LGLLGGITLGIVFFDLLPEALKFGNMFISVLGAVIGLTISVVMDGKLDNHDRNNIDGGYNSYLKTATFMSFGIAMHNLPSGLALGSLLLNSPENGFFLSIALILDGIPEGLTLGVFFKESKISKMKFLLVSILIAIPTGLGSLMGGVLKSPLIICLSLSFAGAMMLYVTLRDTLPAANDLWNGRLTTIGNVLGIILGMLFVSFL
jgi:ZIP family zinc transporter